MLDPARTVIEICGGTRAVAEMTERSENRVRRWTYPTDRRGTGGIIPTEAQHKLMDEAPRRGIDLRPEHFFKAAGTEQ